jgi:hypothetical protein
MLMPLLSYRLMVVWMWMLQKKKDWGYFGVFVCGGVEEAVSVLWSFLPVAVWGCGVWVP